MAQNPPNDPAANQEAHMNRVRASQRRGRLIGLRQCDRHGWRSQNTIQYFRLEHGIAIDQEKITVHISAGEPATGEII